MICISESFFVFLSKVEPFLPSDDIARGFVSDHVIMDSHAIYDSISRYPLVRQYLPMIRDLVSDIDRSELARLLISYLGIHYNDLLVEIDNDERKHKLFRETMSLVLDDLYGGIPS